MTPVIEADHLFFEYENGTTGEYITSTGEAPGTNRLEIACDMGKLVVEDGKIVFDKNEISEREWNKTFTGLFGKPKTEKIVYEFESSGKQHAGIMQNFAEAVLNGTPLLAPGEQGINGLTISNSIHLSGWTGETIDVKNFPHDKYYNELQNKIKNSTFKKEVKVAFGDTRGTY